MIQATYSVGESKRVTTTATFKNNLDFITLEGGGLYGC
jgi:hypothetical protein